MTFSSPDTDTEAFRDFFAKRFPKVPLEAHIDGAYALDAERREQWQAMEEFPPYEFAVDDGETLFFEPFADDSGYGDCFADDGAVKQEYPLFDESSGEVVTLEVAINDCRSLHGEEPLAYDSTEMAQITAYMAYVSRGNPIDVQVPASARSAYEDGKQYYYSRRGQLNFACSHCHMQMSGMNLRAETLSASLGQVTHWPTYRFKWQEVGSLHRRFVECNEQVGATALPLQSETYRNLEYFLSVMSNSLEINGPASRK